MLRSLRLPVHDPISPPLYQGKDKHTFWNAKSKHPYRWGGDTQNGDFPWIGFVGYQLRWDGLARIRPSTVKKHLQRLSEIRNRFLRLIHRLYRSPKGGAQLYEQSEAITLRLRSTLNALSVGKLKLTPAPSTDRFWSNGFQAIRGLQMVEHQLKLLDRYREGVFYNVIKQMKILIGATGTRPPRDRRRLKYYGYPFSYYACFNGAPKKEAPSRPMENGGGIGVQEN